MSEHDQKPERPKHSARTIEDKATRAARAAEALRQNLRKRKQQQRGRQERDATGPSARPNRPGVKPAETSGEARLEAVRPKPYKGA